MTFLYSLYYEGLILHDLGEASNRRYGPDFLMEKSLEVILVTINYRLGPLGFMNLDHPDCSGNQGIKDQRLAFEWVHENIVRLNSILLS